MAFQQKAGERLRHLSCWNTLSEATGFGGGIILSKVRNSLIVLTLAYAGLAFADPINPIDTPAGKARLDPRPDMERMWRTDSTPSTKDGTFSNDHAPAITFADIGFPGEPKEDKDHDHDDFPQRHHHHLVVPEPSTFLLLGVALIYCAKLLRRQLSRV
jgi:hypothetical protein